MSALYVMDEILATSIESSNMIIKIEAETNDENIKYTH